MSMREDGALNIRCSGARLPFSKPVIYQLAVDGSRELVAGRYVMTSAGQIGFDIPSWDRNRPLVIDPVLAWSSFVGQNVDSFLAEAIDSSNNLYLAGRRTG